MEIACWEIQKYTVHCLMRIGMGQKWTRKIFYSEEAALAFIRECNSDFVAYSLTVTKIARFL